MPPKSSRNTSRLTRSSLRKAAEKALAGLRSARRKERAACWILATVKDQTKQKKQNFEAKRDRLHEHFPDESLDSDSDESLDGDESLNGFPDGWNMLSS
jgi:hypothetical protein